MLGIWEGTKRIRREENKVRCLSFQKGGQGNTNWMDLAHI